MALLGLVLTAALTWSVSRLTAQHIGLSSAPVSVIKGLAPSHQRLEAGGRGSSGRQLSDTLPTSRRGARSHSSRDPAAAGRSQASPPRSAASAARSSSPLPPPTGASAAAASRPPAAATAFSPARPSDSSGGDDSGSFRPGRSPDD